MRCSLALSSALLLAALVAFGPAQTARAQDDDLANPIKRAKVGSKARYVFEVTSPSRTDFGVLELRLTKKDGTSFTVDEKLIMGQAGFTQKVVTYSLSNMMKAHIKSIYAKQGFENFEITSSKVTRGKPHNIDDKQFVCNQIHIQFDAVNQKRKCRGDLYYDLTSDAAAAPLGIVVFRSIISYEMAPGRFSFTQQLTMRLTLRDPAEGMGSGSK